MGHPAMSGAPGSLRADGPSALRPRLPEVLALFSRARDGALREQSRPAVPAQTAAGAWRDAEFSSPARRPRESPNSTTSISILRAPLSRMRRRPIAASICNASWSSSRGVLPVSIAATQFRNQGWSWTSIGWVSYKAETASNRPGNFQLCDRRAQGGRTISQVRSQRQIRSFAHLTSLGERRKNPEKTDGNGQNRKFIRILRTQSHPKV